MRANTRTVFHGLVTMAIRNRRERENESGSDSDASSIDSPPAKISRPAVAASGSSLEDVAEPETSFEVEMTKAREILAALRSSLDGSDTVIVDDDDDPVILPERQSRDEDDRSVYFSNENPPLISEFVDSPDPDPRSVLSNFVPFVYEIKTHMEKLVNEDGTYRIIRDRMRYNARDSIARLEFHIAYVYFCFRIFVLPSDLFVRIPVYARNGRNDRLAKFEDHYKKFFTWWSEATDEPTKTFRNEHGPEPASFMSGFLALTYAHKMTELRMAEKHLRNMHLCMRKMRLETVSRVMVDAKYILKQLWLLKLVGESLENYTVTINRKFNTWSGDAKTVRTYVCKLTDHHKPSVPVWFVFGVQEISTLGPGDAGLAAARMLDQLRNEFRDPETGMIPGFGEKIVRRKLLPFPLQYGYGTTLFNEQLISVMEYVGDTSMADILDGRNGFGEFWNRSHDTPSFDTCFIEGCKIMRELDCYGITHTNLDPSKIFYNAQSQQWVVVDFSDAHVWEDKIAYRAPVVETEMLHSFLSKKNMELAAIPEIEILFNYFMCTHVVTASQGLSERGTRNIDSYFGTREMGNLWGFSSSEYVIKPNSLCRSLRFMTLVLVTKLISAVSVSTVRPETKCKGQILKSLIYYLDALKLDVSKLCVHSEKWKTLLHDDCFRTFLDPTFLLWADRKSRNESDVTFVRASPPESLQ